MKITLTEVELAAALENGMHIPRGYNIAGISVSQYSADFCVIRLEQPGIDPVVDAEIDAILKPLPVAA